MTFRHTNKASDDKSPDFNFWLVIDQGDKKKSRWIKLTGLWATKDGEGLAGKLEPHMIVPAGGAPGHHAAQGRRAHSRGRTRHSLIVATSRSWYGLGRISQGSNR
jgi:hypothetical protein